MLEPISIVAVISGISALIVAILSHIKRSECCGNKLITKNSTTPSPPSTPKESSQLLHHLITKPINIPTK